MDGFAGINKYTVDSMMTFMSFSFSVSSHSNIHNIQSIWAYLIHKPFSLLTQLCRFSNRYTYLLYFIHSFSSIHSFISAHNKWGRINNGLRNIMTITVQKARKRTNPNKFGPNYRNFQIKISASSATCILSSIFNS